MNRLDSSPGLLFQFGINPPIRRKHIKPGFSWEVEVMVNRNNKSNQSGRNNQKRASSKPFFTLAALLFAALVGLGFFRFSAAQLEYRLSSIERSIERYTAEEVELKQSLSGLTSPIRIYSYCKDRLGMHTAKQEIVHIPRILRAGAVEPEPQKGWHSSMFAFFGFKVN